MSVDHRCKPVEIRHVASGKVSFFPSVSEASKFLKECERLTLSRINNPKKDTIRWNNGYQYRQWSRYVRRWPSPKYSQSTGKRVTRINTIRETE